MSSSSTFWIHILNIACVGLPIVAFASPGTVFIPVFCCNSLESESESDITNNNGTRRRKVVEMPPLALTSQMLQCYLFAIYAFHMDMITLLLPNATGFCLGFLWSSLYPLRSIQEETLSWKWQYFTSLIIMAVGTYYSFLKDNPYVASTIAAGVGVIMCTYPLPSMKKAFRQSNPEFMGSVQMNVAMFACCTSWVIHSSPLVELDGFVLISNGAGVLVQGSALLLRAYILTTTQRSTSSDEAATKTTTNLLLDHHKKNGGSSALFLSNRSSKSGDGLFVKDNSLCRSSYEEYDTEAYICPTNFKESEQSSSHNFNDRCQTCGGCLRPPTTMQQTNPPVQQKRNLSFKDLFLESYQDVVDVDTIPSREDEEELQGCGSATNYYTSLCCCRTSTPETTRSIKHYDEQRQQATSKICSCDNRNQKNEEETPLLINVSTTAIGSNE